MVIEQLSMKKDNFKKEMIKRRESLSNLKARLSDDVTVDTGQPRPGANNLVEMRLRRAFSVGDIRSSSSICQLPHMIKKRHSHPSSPVPVVSRDFSNKTGGLKMKSPRRKNATITSDFNTVNGQLEMEEKSGNDDCIDIHHKARCLEMMSPRRKNATITCDFKIVNGQQAMEEKSANDDCKGIRLRPCKNKSQDCGKVQNTVIRRHSTMAAPNLWNRKWLQARRITLPSLSSSNTCTTVSEM